MRSAVQHHNSAFRTGDTALYTLARTKLKKGIRAAKVAYKNKTEGYIIDSNPRQVWHGVQNITNYKSHNITPPSADAKMVEDLNNFFARFEVHGQQPPSFDSQQFAYRANRSTEDAIAIILTQH